MKKKYLKIAVICIASLVAAAALFIGISYFASTLNPGLRRSAQLPYSYQNSLEAIGSIVAEEKKMGVSADGLTTVMTHGKKTPRAVVMLHGYSMHPAQFHELGKLFYEKGYNVYIPRFPQHGLSDPKSLSSLRATDLTSTADSAVNIASGLGDEVGIVGLSGGANLATWATIYRNDTVKRTLLISPFYTPSVKNMAAWQEPFMLALYGNRILPDAYNGPLSYAGLAQYMMVYRSLPSRPQVKLESLGMVLASHDFDIHKDRALSVYERLVNNQIANSQLLTTPQEWSLAHDIVNPRGSDLGNKQAEMYQLYLDIYEGRNAAFDI